MTNPDDATHIAAIDREDMLGHINALPGQFRQAWNHAQAQPLPATHRAPCQIVLCGMGGSAIGGDLTAAVIAPHAAIPFDVVRGYELPAYVTGADTLVIASSHSGNTEETLAAAEQARTRGVRLLAITTGGQLAEHARTHGYPLWQFAYASQPRAALGWSFGLLLGLAHRLALAPDLEADLDAAIPPLHAAREQYTDPAVTNPARQTAAALVGRLPVILGGGVFAPVARRWKCQFNENAKVWAEYEAMPEANHNMVASIAFPAAQGIDMAAVFIASPQFDHPRVQLRHDLTRQMYADSGIAAHVVAPQGDSALAQMLHAIQFGDYVSFYMAMRYGVDPTAIAPIMHLKEQLAQHT